MALRKVITENVLSLLTSDMRSSKFKKEEEEIKNHSFAVSEPQGLLLPHLVLEPNCQETTEDLTLSLNYCSLPKTLSG